MDTLGALRVGLNPLWGCEVNQVQQQMWTDLTSTPNYGDVFSVDFSKVSRPDILLSGMPCEDYSSLGSLRGSCGKTGYMYVEQANAICRLEPSAAILEMTGNVVNFRDDLALLVDRLASKYV